MPITSASIRNDSFAHVITIRRCLSFHVLLLAFFLLSVENGVNGNPQSLDTLAINTPIVEVQNSPTVDVIDVRTSCKSDLCAEPRETLAQTAARSPLHKAAMYNDIETIRTLLEKGFA
jgi:hypothetical protein